MVDIVKGCEMWYPNINNKLARWCKALVAKTEEELKKALGGELMENVSRDKLLEEVIKLSSDEEYIGVYTELSKSEMEKNTAILIAEERGIEKGIETGSRNEKINIAKNMLKDNVDISTISKFTDLSIEEIQEIKL